MDGVSPDVHVGRDGWLFRVEETNSVVRSYRFTRSIGRRLIGSAAVDRGYVGRVRPDLVITEIAKRFVNRVQDDAFDLDADVAERFGAELIGTEDAISRTSR